MTAPQSTKPFAATNDVVRDATIAIAAGVAVLVFVLYGIGRMSDTIGGGWLAGEVVEKEFRPDPDIPISIGSKGLSKREVAGDYLFKVNGKNFDEPITVWVDETTYNVSSR